MIKRLLFSLLVTASLSAFAQTTSKYEAIVSEATLRQMVEYLACDEMEGRASGTTGNYVAERFIYDKFKSCGLIPYNWTYTQSVVFADTVYVRNVVGILPSNNLSDDFIIISAHYDHLGEMAGKVYNGADDNASGVAVMLSLVDMFSKMKKDGAGPAKNILFVAFDGKEQNMSGSRYFVDNLEIPKSNIICDVNLDMLGTDLAPVGQNKDYLIFLGEERLPSQYQGIASYLAGRIQYSMDLDRTFYGSKDFAKFFYGMSDQISFADAGIPAVTFSSGFHDHTYKTTDDVSIINFPLLLKRTRLIFNFIDRLIKY